MEFSGTTVIAAGTKEFSMSKKSLLYIRVNFSLIIAFLIIQSTKPLPTMTGNNLYMVSAAVFIAVNLFVFIYQKAIKPK
jgi:hypothetical protein